MVSGSPTKFCAVVRDSGNKSNESRLGVVLDSLQQERRNLLEEAAIQLSESLVCSFCVKCQVVNGVLDAGVGTAVAEPNLFHPQNEPTELLRQQSMELRFSVVTSVLAGELKKSAFKSAEALQKWCDLLCLPFCALHTCASVILACPGPCGMPQNLHFLCRHPSSSVIHHPSSAVNPSSSESLPSRLQNVVEDTIMLREMTRVAGIQAKDLHARAERAILGCSQLDRKARELLRVCTVLFQESLSLSL